MAHLWQPCSHGDDDKRGQNVELLAQRDARDAPRRYKKPALYISFLTNRHFSTAAAAAAAEAASTDAVWAVSINCDRDATVTSAYTAQLQRCNNW